MTPVWEVALRARAAGTGADAEAARLELIELERLRHRAGQLQARAERAMRILGRAEEFRRFTELVDAVRRALTLDQ